MGIGRIITFRHRVLLFCLIAGTGLLAFAIGAAALGSAAGFAALPAQLAAIDERLPGIFRLHMICGGTGLMLLPWAIALRRRKKVHRGLGRAALGLLWAAALTALPSSLASVATPMARAGFFTQAILTLYFLTAGFEAIRRRDRQRHRRLMLYSAALVSGAFVLRLMLYCIAILGLDFDAAYAAIAWLAWAIPFACAAALTRLGRPGRLAAERECRA
ncbi:MAG: DUF2306 domain-containing protein [Rhodomicrobium sp.]